jgi:hypothetical protein
LTDLVCCARGCVRLAEGTKLALLSSSGLTVASGDAEVDPSAKMEEDGVNSSGANRINAVGDVGEAMGKSGNSSQDYRNNGGDVTGNHQTNSSFTENDRKAHPKDAELQISVANAFRAYGEFLRHLSKGNPPSQAGDSNHAGNHKPVISSSTALEGQAAESNRGVMDGETHKVDGKAPDALLMRDLETCFTWNMQRLSRVLPSVFRHLPDLATGKEAMVSLLVSTVDPVDLSNYEYWVTVGEFAVMGREVESMARLIKASLSWDSIEQQFFWRLMSAEVVALSPTPALQASGFPLWFRALHRSVD